MILLQVLPKGNKNLRKHHLKAEVQATNQDKKKSVSESEEHILNYAKCGDS